MRDCRQQQHSDWFHLAIASQPLANWSGNTYCILFFLTSGCITFNMTESFQAVCAWCHMRNLYKAAQSHPLTLSSSRWQTDKPVSCLFCLTCIQSLRNSPHIQSPHILPCMCWVPLLYLTADIITHISLIHHSKDSQLFFPGDTRVCPCIHFFLFIQLRIMWCWSLFQLS